MKTAGDINALNENTHEQAELDKEAKRILDQKKESWKPIDEAIGSLLGKEKLFRTLLQDFLPQKGVVQNEAGEEVVTEKARGFSFNSFKKILNFVAGHPGHVFQLIKLALSPSIYTDPDFHQHILEMPEVKEFIKERADDLPHIANVMKGMDVEIFKEGGILDAKAMETLQAAFKDEESIKKILEIGISITKSPSDWNQAISDSLGLLAENPHFQHYFAEKGPAIADYLKSISAPGTDLGTTLETYKVNTKVLDQIPALLNSLPQIKETFESFRTAGLFPAIEKALDMVENNPQLREFFVSNPTFIPDIAKGVIANVDSVKAITEGYKFDNSILDILSTVMVRPEIAKSIVADLNKGNYIHLTDTLINTLNDPEIELREVLKDQAEKGLFDKLIDGVIAQQGYQQELEKYGLKTEELPNLSKIFPLLLDKPKELQQVFNDFKDGNYNEMVKKLISLGGETPEIKQYFAENKELFVKVLNHSLKQNPSLGEINIEADLYNIVPALLNHPKELIEIVTLSEQGKYGEVGKKFFDLIQSDQSIKGYFLENAAKFKQISEKIIGLEIYGIQDEVSQIFNLLLAENNQPRIKELLDLYETGQWNELIKSTCRFMEDDPAFNQYIQDNKRNFSKIITAVIDKSPAIKTYTHGANVGDIGAAILKDPKSVREFVESYERGLASALYKGAKVIGTKVLLDSEFRAGLAAAASGWLLGEDGKQQLVDGIIKELSARNPADKKPINLSNFIQKFGKDVVGDDKQQKQKLAEWTTKNTLLDGVRIGDSSESNRLKLENLEINGLTFVNSQLVNVSFGGSVLQSVSFTGASFSNIDFTGATIDAATLKTMLDSLKQGSISLDGAIIVGDLSAVDLSGISLRGADLSKVTSMKNANLKDADLTSAIMPEQNKSLLTETYNLDKASFTTDFITPEIALAQKEKVITKAVDSIAVKARQNGEAMTADQQDQLQHKLRELANDSSLAGSYVKEVLESTPVDVISASFPINTSALKHVSAYLNKTSDLMTILYNNRNDLENIKDSIVANLMADKVTEKLFNEGNNRGQDGLMIRKMMQDLVVAFKQENPDLDFSKVLMEKINSGQLIDDITNELKSKSKYTTAGMVTGGIYLPEGAIDDPLINKLKVKMNEEFGSKYKLNESEMMIIKSMADQIGMNLFGNGSTTDRKADTDLIHQNLKNAFHQIKLDRKGEDLSELLNSNKSDIVGKVEKGWVSTSRTGLTELYFKEAKATTVGLISGGIYLDPAEVGTNNFIGTLKSKLGEITKIGEALRGHIIAEPAKNPGSNVERVNAERDKPPTRLEKQV